MLIMIGENHAMIGENRQLVKNEPVEGLITPTSSSTIR